MRRLLTVMLIFSFLGIAVFGFVAMGHKDSHEGCIAATARGYCPTIKDSVQSVLFHVGTFLSFAIAVFTPNVSGVLLFFIVLIQIIGGGFQSFVNIQSLRPKFHFHQGRFLESYFAPVLQKFNFWLALHENSPAVYFRTPM